MPPRSIITHTALCLLIALQSARFSRPNNLQIALRKVYQFAIHIQIFQLKQINLFLWLDFPRFLGFFFGILLVCSSSIFAIHTHPNGTDSMKFALSARVPIMRPATLRDQLCGLLPASWIHFTAATSPQPLRRALPPSQPHRPEFDENQAAQN